MKTTDTSKPNMTYLESCFGHMVSLVCSSLDSLKLPSVFVVWFFWTFKINHIIWKHGCSKSFLSNIMKYDKSDVEWHIGIQGMHLSAFLDYFWKREGSLKLILATVTFMLCEFLMYSLTLTFVLVVLCHKVVACLTAVFNGFCQSPYLYYPNWELTYSESQFVSENVQCIHFLRQMLVKIWLFPVKHFACNFI